MSFKKVGFLFKRKHSKFKIVFKPTPSSVTFHKTFKKVKNLNYILGFNFFACEKNFTFNTKDLLVRLKLIILKYQNFKPYYLKLTNGNKK